MLLGGDTVELQIDVGAGCTLGVREDIGGTVAYDGEGRRSRWSVSIRVGDGGLLCWNGKPLVIADGANVRRSTGNCGSGWMRGCCFGRQRYSVGSEKWVEASRLSTQPILMDRC